MNENQVYHLLNRMAWATHAQLSFKGTQTSRMWNYATISVSFLNLYYQIERAMLKTAR